MGGVDAEHLRKARRRLPTTNSNRRVDRNLRVPREWEEDDRGAASDHSLGQNEVKTAARVDRRRQQRRKVLEAIALVPGVVGLDRVRSSEAICGQNEFWQFNVNWDEKGFRVSNGDGTDRVSFFRVIGSREKGKRAPLIVISPFGKDLRNLEVLEAASLSQRRVYFYQPGEDTGLDAEKQADDLLTMTRKLSLPRFHLVGEQANTVQIAKSIIQKNPKGKPTSLLLWASNTRTPPSDMDIRSIFDVSELPATLLGDPERQCEGGETVREE
eukprot:CAMPEP_0184485978 /NCGR_PEP_ID=MMETSP0113_2-20130426/7545_1 /TAXON_ID=91329 /ORGANISM="Norrisiella sphaerica, Strain BC52" /LENGTH=269 /DNA_ID=CAMNT_0026867665 /DNA_START=25 /DNA_END=834 /DNA_ORIENTATION=+